jgi:hypothetical protein
LQVFWNWIGERDHGGGHNVLLSAAGEHLRLYSYDHTESLGVSLTERGGPLSFGPLPDADLPQNPDAAEEVDMAISEIEQLPFERVERVVSRLSFCLDPETRKWILEVLIARRTSLRELLANGPPTSLQERR